ncbi:MAG: hypothetical protein ACWA49_09100 [Ruegeria sp.]
MHWLNGLEHLNTQQAGFQPGNPSNPLPNPLIPFTLTLNPSSKNDIRGSERPRPN